MRVVIRPLADSQREIDLTHRFVAAIAQELWREYGGNQQLNWIEAERHLERIMNEVRAEAGETLIEVAAPIRRSASAPGHRGRGRKTSHWHRHEHGSAVRASTVSPSVAKDGAIVAPRSASLKDGRIPR